MNNPLNNILAKLDDIDEKQRYYIFIGVLVFFFLLDYFVLMRPQLKTLTKINPEIKVLSEDVKNAQNDIARADQYKKTVEDYKSKNLEVDEMVRSRSEVPIILERISLIADSSKVKIEQISPDNDGAEMLLENSERRYFSLPIAIDARSGYHNLGKFINAIEKEDIYLDVSGFVVGAVPKSRRHSIKMTLLAIVYEDV